MSKVARYGFNDLLIPIEEGPNSKYVTVITDSGKTYKTEMFYVETEEQEDE